MITSVSLELLIYTQSTVPPKPAVLRQNVYSCIAQYIACGLDPIKCHQFVQSHVTGHTELAWILTCMTPIGELQRNDPV